MEYTTIYNFIKSVRDLELSFYSGVNEADLNLLKKYHDISQTIMHGRIIDYFGMIINRRYLQLETFHDQKINELPFPSDKFHAEAIEYVALVKAFHESKISFNVIELGCGWAPWIGLAGVLAKKFGKMFKLLGVEGSPEYCTYAEEHLKDNGLYESSLIINAIVSDKNTPLYFRTSPSSNNAWGERPRLNEGVGYEKVKSLTISECLVNFDKVDILHLDIQGAEYDALSCCNVINSINHKVKRIIIGTHSRSIEGKIFDFMHEHGWQLEYEKPCRFNYHKNAPYLDMTTIDGTQVWLNVSIS